MPEILKKYFPVVILFVVGGLLTGGLAFLVMGRAFGYDKIQAPALVPGFLVGAVAASVIAALIIRYRHVLLERLAEEQKISAKLREEIAERERIAEALQESEERFSLAMIGANDGLWDQNLTTGKVYYSPRWCRMLGYEPEELAPTMETWERLVDPDDRQRVRQQMKDYFSGASDSFEAEFRMRHKDGTWVTILSRAFLVREDGRPSRLVGTHVDISLRKQLEEQIHHVQKMEAIGQLTGGIAHDFNNLLGVMLGNIQVLRDKFGENSSLLAIERAVDRGAELTSRLLAFSRQQSLKPRPINLVDMVVEVEDLLRRTLGAPIDVETHVAEGTWVIAADPGQLQNALLNLAINARDAMPSGGKLTISCWNERLADFAAAVQPDVAPGEYVILSVADTGDGIPEEVRQRVFEPFFTTKEIGKGSGLGLSMVYGFAKQSGGTVTIDSEVGAGTTVKLYIPKCTSPKETEIKPEEKSGPPAMTPSIPDPANDGGGPPLGRNEKILVVEDDADLRTLAEVMLQNLNYVVSIAANAANAEEVLNDSPMPDLVLSDVILPGGTSGPEFANKVRVRYPDLKFVFMSGYTADAAHRRGLLESDAVLINKPFDMKTLAVKLREVLDA